MVIVRCGVFLCFGSMLGQGNSLDCRALISMLLSIYFVDAAAGRLGAGAGFSFGILEWKIPF